MACVIIRLEQNLHPFERLVLSVQKKTLHPFKKKIVSIRCVTRQGFVIVVNPCMVNIVHDPVISFFNTHSQQIFRVTKAAVAQHVLGSLSLM